MGKQNKNTQVSSLVFRKRLQIILLRTFFKLLYHQFSWTYDWVASIVSLGAWKTWVQSPLPYIMGPRTLEVGFGPGHLQASLKHKGISVIGIDESIQMGRIAQSRLVNLGFKPLLVRAYAQDLPFAQKSFDQVVMPFPAEFLFTRPTFNELNRVLGDKGRVWILPWAWITGRKPLQKVIAWLNRVTGEAPTWNENYLDSFASMGFKAHSEMINFPFSKVLLIRLEKIAHQA